MRRQKGRRPSGCPQHGRACRRQLRTIGLGWRRWDGRCDRCLAEPGIQRLAAAVVVRIVGLRLALRIAGRAVQADMEMLVVPVPRHELAQPGAVAGRGMAEPLLDPLVHHLQ